MKLAGSTWGASANTLRSSALALCYSVAEYCAPVWSRSVHTSRVDVQLNSTMCLISGTIRSTPLPWLPVLSNIEPPALQRKAATDKLLEKIVKHDGQSSLIYLAHHCYDWHLWPLLSTVIRRCAVTRSWVTLCELWNELFYVNKDSVPSYYRF